MKLRNLFSDHILCLLRRTDIPHLAEGIHVERQVVELVLIYSDRRVNVIIKFRKLVHIFPDFFIGCMENMRAVFMHIDSFNFLTVNISADMVPFVNDKTGFSPFLCFVSKNRTK